MNPWAAITGSDAALSASFCEMLGQLLRNMPLDKGAEQMVDYTLVEIRGEDGKSDKWYVPAL